MLSFDQARLFPLPQIGSASEIVGEVKLDYLLLLNISQKLRNTIWPGTRAGAGGTSFSCEGGASQGEEKIKSSFNITSTHL